MSGTRRISSPGTSLWLSREKNWAYFFSSLTARQTAGDVGAHAAPLIALRAFSSFAKAGLTLQGDPAGFSACGRCCCVAAGVVQIKLVTSAATRPLGKLMGFACRCLFMIDPFCVLTTRYDRPS